MDTWKWEMEMCCSMHIQSLYEKLLQCQQQGITTGINVAPDYGAAPYDETLFDTLRLSVKTTEEGLLALRGAVSYWSPRSGFSGKSSTIRTFDNLESCLEWMENKSAASDECAEIMSERCR